MLALKGPSNVSPVLFSDGVFFFSQNFTQLWKEKWEIGVLNQKAYRILNYKMHTTYISDSIGNTFLCNICFIHGFFNCSMASNWWQPQVVTNQSDTAQKSLQPHFSCRRFPLTHFHAYHSSSIANLICPAIEHTILLENLQCLLVIQQAVNHLIPKTGGSSCSWIFSTLGGLTGDILFLFFFSADCPKRVLHASQWPLFMLR